MKLIFGRVSYTECSLFVFFSRLLFSLSIVFFFFNDPATTEIYTLSLHDALPIYVAATIGKVFFPSHSSTAALLSSFGVRSEEHTSELQSHVNLVCRLLLEKKKNAFNSTIQYKCARLLHAYESTHRIDCDQESKYN